MDLPRNYSSHFTLIHKNCIADLNLSGKLRDSKFAIPLINQTKELLNVSRSKLKATKILEQVHLKLTARDIDLWNLPAFFKSYFKRFAICNLHLKLLDNCRKLFKYMIAKEDKSFLKCNYNYKYYSLYSIKW